MIRTIPNFLRAAFAAWVCLSLVVSARAEETPPAQIDFASQVLPILQKNCLACHNKTDAESDLVLESPQAMEKGGNEGAVIVPGKSDESRLVRLAGHVDEPHMPPEDNTAGAKKLTDEELSLLKTWIDQGAKGSAVVASSIQWQPLPPGVNPVLAVATSSDGRLIAAGRANQVFLYHAGSGMDLGRLSDPHLTSSPLYGRPGVADLDLIQSLAFSPNGSWIASGGYRTVKLWRRDSAELHKWSGLADEPTAVAVVEPDRIAIVGSRNGSLQKIDLNLAQLSEPWSAHAARVARVTILNAKSFVSASDDGRLMIWETGSGKKLAELTSPAPVKDVVAVSETVLAVAHGDNSLRMWSLQEAPAGSESRLVVAETAKLAEGIQIVGIDASRAAQRLVSGAADGTIVIYDSASNAVVRQWNHGSPIRRVSISADANRVACVGEDGKARIWDSSNGNLIADLGNDMALKDTVAEKLFGRDLAKRQVDNAKQDLEAEKQRLQQETENQKKAQETLTKSDEERKKKTESADATNAEVKVAEQSLATLMEQVASANTALAEAIKKRDESMAAYDDFFVRLTDQQNVYVKANDDLRLANQAFEQAQQLANQNKDNAELLKQVTESQERVRIATESRNAQEVARAAALKDINDAAIRLEQTRQAERDGQSLVTKAKEAIEPANKLLAEKRTAAEKAANEQKEAAKTFESATASVDQAKSAIEQAQTRVNQCQADLTKSETRSQLSEQEFAESEKRNNETPIHIKDIQFSADSQWLTTIADSGSISTWTAAQGQFANSIAVIPEAITGLAPAGAGELLVITPDRSLRSLRTLPTWSLDRTIGDPDGESPFSDRVTALQFSADSSELAVGGGSPSRSGEIKIYAVGDGALKRDLPSVHSDVVYSLAYSPDGQYLASSAADRFMKVTNLQTGEIHKTFEGHTHHVLGVGWQADGRVLATAGADKVIKLWNFIDGSQIRTIQGFGKEVTSVQYYGPNDTFFAVSGDQSIYQCNLGGNRNAVGRADDFLYCVSTSHIGDTVAFGGHDSVVRVIDSSGKARVSMKPQ